MNGFPKTVRLLKSDEFRFKASRKLETAHFLFYLKEAEGTKLGITLPKKSLKHAVARNRVKRLLREAFREKISNFNCLSINCVGLKSLKGEWKSLSKKSVQGELNEINETQSRSKKAGK